MKKENNPYCLFVTPEDIIDELFKYEPDLINKSKILEPCAGTGAILKTIKNWNKHLDNYVTAVEIQPELEINIIGLADKLIIDNFLYLDFGNEKFDSIICNPPFTHSNEFIKQCYSLLNENGKMAFLLPLIQLVSKCRHKLYNELIPQSIYFLCKRPGGDLQKINPTGYCWVVWEKGYYGHTNSYWIYP